MEKKKFGLIDQIEHGTKYNVKEYIEKNPEYIDNLLFGHFGILDNMNNSIKAYKESLVRRKIDLELTHDEIDFITTSAYNRVYEQLFEQENNLSEKSNKSFNEDLEKHYTYQEDKFEINSMFNRFCFSEEVISLLLGEDEKANQIKRDIIELQSNDENSIPLLLFKSFLKQNNIDIIETEKGYLHGDFEFELTRELQYFEGGNYYDILSNSLTDVTDHNRVSQNIAKKFILFLISDVVKYIFCVTYSPDIKSYILREIKLNGYNSELGSFENMDEVYDELADLVDY
jgi:hypothetical protein